MITRRLDDNEFLRTARTASELNVPSSAVEQLLVQLILDNKVARVCVYVRA
jgi:hypothetical protein